MEILKIFNFILTTIFNIPYCKNEQLYLNDCFGIFITIEREKGDIHGCIGHWEKYNLSEKDKIVILEKVSLSAMYKDSRNRDGIIWEPESKIKIHLMQDCEKISKEPLKFDNNKYGLIVENKKTATFLPGVFCITDWQTIKTHILKKANLNNGNFYFYKTETYESNFTQCMQYCLQTYAEKIGNFFNLNYGYFFPYSIHKNIIQRSPNEIVRNIATMGDLLNYNNINKIITSDTVKKIQKDLKSYEFNKLSDTEKTFFSRINNICFEISKQGLETDFQLGQSLIYHSKICKKHTKKDLENMLTEILRRTIDLNIIFRLNWQIQAVCYGLTLDISHLKQLYIIFTKWFKIFYSKSLETNYLVVCFELLLFLKKNLNFNYIDKYLFKIFIDLSKRFNCNIGLFSFLDDSCRIDISGHFLNGLTYIKI